MQWMPEFVVVCKGQTESLSCIPFASLEWTPKRTRLDPGFEANLPTHTEKGT